MANATAWTASSALHVGSGGPISKKMPHAEGSGILQGSPLLHEKVEKTKQDC
jgi:hypothetical protein